MKGDFQWEPAPKYQLDRWSYGREWEPERKRVTEAVKAAGPKPEGAPLKAEEIRAALSDLADRAAMSKSLERGCLNLLSDPAVAKLMEPMAGRERLGRLLAGLGGEGAPMKRRPDEKLMFSLVFTTVLLDESEESKVAYASTRGLLEKRAKEADALYQELMTIARRAGSAVLSEGDVIALGCVELMKRESLMAWSVAGRVGLSRSDIDKAELALELLGGEAKKSKGSRL